MIKKFLPKANRKNLLLKRDFTKLINKKSMNYEQSSEALTAPPTVCVTLLWPFKDRVMRRSLKSHPSIGIGSKILTRQKETRLTQRNWPMPRVTITT